MGSRPNRLVWVVYLWDETYPAASGVTSFIGFGFVDDQDNEKRIGQGQGGYNNFGIKGLRLVTTVCRTQKLGNFQNGRPSL